MRLDKNFPVGSIVKFSSQGLDYISKNATNKTFSVISENYTVKGYSKFEECEESIEFCCCSYHIVLDGVSEKFIPDELIKIEKGA